MTKQNDKVFSITDTVLQNSTDIKEHIELDKITELRLNAQLKSIKYLESEIESLKTQIESLVNSNYESKQANFQFKNSITEFLNTRKSSDVMQVKQSICEDLNMRALTILKVATNKKIDELIESAREQSIVNETAHIIEQYEHKLETE